MPSRSLSVSAKTVRISVLEKRIATLEAALATQSQAAADLRRSEARLAVLADASHCFAAASTDLARLSRTMTGYVAHRIGDLCALRLISLDGTTLITAHTAHAHPEAQALVSAIDQIPQRVDVGHTRQVIRDGKPLYMPCVAQDSFRAAVPPQFLPYLDRFGVDSIIIVPLRERGQVIGTLTLTRNTGGDPYTPDDLAMLQDLADRAALVVAYAQLVGAWREATRIKDDTFALLNTIFASIPVGLGVLDADLRYIRVNQTLAAIDGLPAIVYPGRTPAELLSGLASAFEPFLRQVLTTGNAIHDVEIRGVTLTNPGEPRTWLTSYYPVRGNLHVVTGVGVVMVDITERTQAERVLRERDEQLRLAYDAAQLGTWRYDIVTGIIQLDARAQLHYGLKSDAVPAARILAQVHEDDRTVWWQTVSATADSGGDGRAMAEYRVVHPDGDVRWIATHARVYVADTGAGCHPVLSSGTSQDITTRKQVEDQVRAALAAEQQARAAAEQATLRIGRLQTMTAALAAALTRDDVVRIILDQICQATGAMSGTLLLRDARGDLLEIVGQTPPSVVQNPLRPTPLDAPLPSAQATRTQTAIWIESVAVGEAQFPGFGRQFNDHGISAYAALPLVTAGMGIGVLSLGFATTQTFSADDRVLLLALAQQCAQAIDHARLYAEVQEAHSRLQYLSHRLLETQEQERRHLARELHDEVGQALTGLRLSLELASRLQPEARADRLAEAHRATQDLITQVRALSLDLRPAMLDDMGLLPALLWQINRYREQTGITVDLRHWGLEKHMPPTVETVAYRVVQEALTNIARYAQVPTAIVSLLASPEQLLIQVRDVGLGFVLEEALSSARSSGLTGMQERVALLNGTLNIETAPGMGTCVTAELPLDAEP